MHWPAGELADSWLGLCESLFVTQAHKEEGREKEEGLVMLREWKERKEEVTAKNGLF